MQIVAAVAVTMLELVAAVEAGAGSTWAVVEVAAFQGQNSELAVWAAGAVMVAVAVAAGPDSSRLFRW